MCVCVEEEGQLLWCGGGGGGRGWEYEYVCVLILPRRIAKDPRFERLPCLHKGTYADDCLINRVTQVSGHYSNTHCSLRESDVHSAQVLHSGDV